MLLPTASLLVAMLSAPAGAQGIADPGALLEADRRLQDQLENPPMIEPGDDAVQAPPPPADLVVPPGGPTFRLNRIVFGESHFIAADELRGIAAQFEGRDIDFSGLYRIVAAVNAVYRQRGIVTASAVLPPQDIENGVVRVDLVEGRVGEVRLHGQRRLTSDFTGSRLRLVAGEVVDPPALSKSVTWFNRTHLAQVNALLRPGTAPGLTDIELAVVEPKRNRLEIALDNFGNDSTGTWQLGLAFIHYGLLEMDDRFTARINGTRGNISGSLSYNFAAGPRGDRLGIAYSRNAINIVSGPFMSLGITGQSQSLAISSVHPIVADARRFYTFNAELSAGTSSTDQSGFAVGRGETYKGTIGFTFSEAIRRFSWWATVNAALVGRHDAILDEWTAHVVFNGASGAAVSMPGHMTVSGTLAAQYGVAPFLPADQLFQIGGVGTVRGYPANTFGGDSGAFANLELAHAMPYLLGGLNVFAFSDAGMVASATQPSRFLASAGFGIRWDKPDGRVGANLTAAFPFTQAVPDQGGFRLYGRLRFLIE